MGLPGCDLLLWSPPRTSKPQLSSASTTGFVDNGVDSNRHRRYSMVIQWYIFCFPLPECFYNRGWRAILAVVDEETEEVKELLKELRNCDLNQEKISKMAQRQVSGAAGQSYISCWYRIDLDHDHNGLCLFFRWRRESAGWNSRYCWLYTHRDRGTDGTWRGIRDRLKRKYWHSATKFGCQYRFDDPRS